MVHALPVWAWRHIGIVLCYTGHRDRDACLLNALQRTYPIPISLVAPSAFLLFCASAPHCLAHSSTFYYTLNSCPGRFVGSDDCQECMATRATATCWKCQKVQCYKHENYEKLRGRCHGRVWSMWMAALYYGEWIHSAFATTAAEHMPRPFWHPPPAQHDFRQFSVSGICFASKCCDCRRSPTPAKWNNNKQTTKPRK